MKYIGNAKTVNTKFGEMTKLMYHINDLKDLVKFMEDNQMQFVNIDIKQKKEPSKAGYTHYGEIDTWKPESQNATTQPIAPQDDDLPF